jgi:TolB-like protein/Flp pilus assembly protein TadD
MITDPDAGMPTEALTDTDPFARDAFISYANQDKAVADAVCASLEVRGLRCWIAPRDVMPGTLYADAIVRALNGARILVLLLSEHAVASPHVGKEIERASSKRRPILALRLDAAPLTPALEYFLSESQWVDATAVGLDTALGQTAAAVQSLLRPGAPATTGATPSPRNTASALPSSGRRPWLIIGVVGALLIVGAALLATKSWRPAERLADAGNGQTKPATLTATDRSVAVLPFEDLSEKKDEAYFSDGLSTELIDLLAKVPGLRVTARVSSFYFKGKQATLEEIAHALNVTHVLEGSVRSSGENLRITTDLVNVATGTPVWSETYDRKLDDIFKIQDDIAGSVVGALKVSLLGKGIPHATPTASAAAYTAFLKCEESFMSHENREGLAAAIETCQKAVDLDPSFAPAWIGLGSAIKNQFVGFGGPTDDYRIARARAYAAFQHALALEPDSPAPHAAIAGLLYQMDFDPAAAQVEINKARALDPTAADERWLEGYIASVECRFDEALRAQQIDRLRNPLDTDVAIQIGNVHYRSGELGPASSAYRDALAISNETGSVHYRLGLVALLAGDPKGALAEFEQEPDQDFHAVGLPMAYDALGRKADADRALANAEQVAAQGAAYQIALIYAARKDTEHAFAWLDRAYAQRDAGMLWIKCEPFLKNLRQDPRYEGLLHKMHLN